MERSILIISLFFSSICFGQTKIRVSSVGVTSITTDTSSLSNRINLKLNIADTANKWITLISRSHDSVFYTKGGSSVFAYKDSVGGGGGGSSSKVYPPYVISNDSIYKRYNALAYGLKGDGSTDDAAAFNALLTTVYNAGGGEIFLPYTGHSYIIAGALQTSDSCQVCIPFTDTANIQTAPHIVIKGEFPPNNFTDWGLASKKTTQQAVTIESTSTKQLGSVFGSRGSTGVINGNFTQVTLENLDIKVRSKSGSTHVAPAMAAIDASGMEMIEIRRCKIETQSPQDSSVQPLSTAYGIKTPAVNNWAHVILNDVMIQNFYYGMTGNEHVSATNVTIATCYSGVQLLTGYHAVHFEKLNLWWNRNQIVIDGTAYFIMHDVDFEEYNPPNFTSTSPTQWFNTVNDISENSGLSKGDIVYQRTIANVGTSNTLISNASSSILTSSIGTQNGTFPSLSVSGAASTPVSFTSPVGNSNFDITATNATTSGRTVYFANNDAGKGIRFGKWGSAFAGYKIIAANDGAVWNGSGGGDLAILNDAASGSIRLAAGGSSTEHMKIESTGKISFPGTNTAGGTTGAQTINKVSGSVNFAAGAQTLVVTNSLATTSSVIIVTVYGTDATATSARVTRGSGSFTITLNATATAETTVGFLVINNF